MIHKFKLTSEFSRNIITLMTGTIISQAISVVIIPILTRIYSQSDFGQYALYSSLVAILSIFATGRYELAIIQARSKNEANSLVFGAMTLALMFSAALFLIILFFHDIISNLFDEKGEIYWIYLIPFSILAVASHQTLNYWLNRQKYYLQMSKNRILSTSLSGGTNVALGFTGLNSFGLIIGYFIGQLITSSILLKKFLNSDSSFNKLRILAVYKKYKNYPKHDLPASVMNTMAQQGPNLFLTPFFGAVNAGNFFLIQRVFMIPITLISSSVGSVFRQSATEQFQLTGKFNKVLFNTVKRLFFISLIPTIVFMLFSQRIFYITFGNEWIIAGKYARILAPMFMFKFVVSPITYAFYIKNKLHYNIYGQMMYLFSILLSLYTGYLLNDFLLSIYMISISGMLVYFIYFIISWRISK
uniref:lipopolysaccharide biosynthesis protein n=1 Tax=Algoriphagus sp. TaxID=1872435 RepID=UPI0040487909